MTLPDLTLGSVARVDPTARDRSAQADRTMVLSPQQLEQALRIPDGECLPVVVEVGQDLDLAAPLAEARRPFRELAFAVVAAAPTRAVMQPDMRPRGGE